MNLLGLVSGMATFYGLKELKEPLRRIAVLTTSELFHLYDRSREVVYQAKEGFEDIIAEAHYENMKRNQMLRDSVGMEKGGEVGASQDELRSEF